MKHEFNVKFRIGGYSRKFYQVSFEVGECTLLLYKPFDDDDGGIGKHNLYFGITKNERYYEKSIHINLMHLTDEEMFQKSLIWDFPIDLYLLRSVQDYYEEHPFPDYKFSQEWVQTLEY